VEMETQPADMMQHPQPQQFRRSQRIKETSGHVVLPTDTVKEPERLRSGSKWRQHDLALLRVKFDPDEDSDLAVLDVEHQWSPSQHQSMILLLTQRMFWHLLTLHDRSRDLGSRTCVHCARGFK